MKYLYNYCAGCGRRIEVGDKETVYEVMLDEVGTTFCSDCVRTVDVDEEYGYLFGNGKGTEEE